MLSANNSETRRYDKQLVTVLGSTGSIGANTLDVISRHSDRFQLFALTANTNVDTLYKQCIKYQPSYAVMRNESAADDLRSRLVEAGSKTEILSGEDALSHVVTDASVDTVMAAIVGAAGLLPTLAAVESGKKVLLANKEALVMAGRLFKEAVSRSGAMLLPIDSEHNAIFQCLPQDYDSDNQSLGIRKLLLTGSGGPFRTWSMKDISKATPEQACKHPNWSMGKKISVDSATLMNKGLEFIEACWLFDVRPSDIEVVIHPQSVIHSMVEYVDGSILAQLGNPDMRTPIAHALAWPKRMESGVSPLDLIGLSDLQFEAPDHHRFPGLALAIDAASSSGASTILNAANEIAVDAFLQNRISFGDISHLLMEVMSTAQYREPDNLDDVLDLDLNTRISANKLIERKISA
jgi:1-deoxy-D-xylulose-5-phosphate reductoisomerase